MSSFLATANTVATKPTAADTLKNDGWFPDIELGALREQMKLDGNVTDARLRPATLDAMASCNAELRSWQLKQIDAGCASLADVTAPQLGGESTHVIRYRRAVFNLVRADLTEQYRGLDTTKSGGQKAEELEATICEARRNVRIAIADICGRRRTTVELI
ncbi:MULTISPECIES: head completion/stabilization protein [unclassified Paraburkholderia]|uniref:head completion/stabilization protein n=1 Tax=unclassified Paraburkholderia TaxID=2615204 RepID=UPI002AB00FE8|nr:MULTISPECIES: head completion/stabilization protein [unclassified Paraburkholderia]